MTISAQQTIVISEDNWLCVRVCCVSVELNESHNQKNTKHVVERRKERFMPH